MTTLNSLSTGFGLLLALTLLTLGCGSLGKAGPIGRQDTASGVPITLHDAQTRLSAASDNLIAVVAGAARDIEKRTDSLRIKRFSLVVRVRVLQECQRILQMEDPRLGALNLLTLGHQTLDYFETGDGRKAAGDLAELAVPPLEEHIRLLGESMAYFVPKDVYEECQKEVRALAEANPITGETFTRNSRPGQILKRAKTGTLAAILNMPFKPFKFGEGIGEAAAAIDRFAVQTEKLTDVVANMPLQAQWHVQYLLYAMEDNPSFGSVLSEVEAASDALQLAAKAVDDLPAKVGAEVRTTLDEIEDSQEEVRGTLREMRQVAVEAKAAILSVKEATTSIGEATTSIGEVSASVSEAGASLTATAEAWLPTTEALDRLLNPPEDPDKPVDPDPFKIPQVTAAANALTVSATELRTLVADLRGLLDGEELPGALERVDDTARFAVDHTAERAEDVTDHITLRGIQFVLAIFIMAFAYRWATRRIPRRAS